MAPLSAERIVIEVDRTLVAEVDVDALDRIVTNLVSNACRYGAAPITVSAEEAYGVLHVTVSDSGPGVPEEFVPQLFDRFARSSDERVDRHGNRARPRDRALVRPRAQRRGELPAGRTARRRVRADASAPHRRLKEDL